jgi:hypothetical protein
VVVLATFPPAVYEGSFFPAYSPTFVFGDVFEDTYSNKSEVESYCGFDLHFLVARDGEHFFMCSLAIWFYIPLKKFCLVHLLISLLVHCKQNLKILNRQFNRNFILTKIMFFFKYSSLLYGKHI